LDDWLWTNLHEDSLLREFGISLGTLENNTISMIDPDANNFPMMNRDNNILTTGNLVMLNQQLHYRECLLIIFIDV